MFRKRTLDNGMVLITERMEHVRSVSLGIWVRSGSRDERAGEGGVSHFLEHMFFKGTERRSAERIAMETDSIGGELNAFTSKEGTTFYIKLVDEYMEQGVDLLVDIFTSSTFPEEEIEKEKGVIIEEIRMVEDTPDDYVHDLFYASVWGGGAGLGAPVLGTEETVSSFRREMLVKYVEDRYIPSRTVIACAGSFDEERLFDMLNARLGSLRREGLGAVKSTPVFRPERKAWNKKLSEAHICIGIPGIRQASPERYGLLLINTALGGGISSRLFQEIREKRGLVYSVYSFLSSYADTGLWGIYAGTGKDKVDEVLECALREMRALPGSIRLEELERAKAQVKSGIVLGLESSSRRMQNIANQEIYYGEYFTPAQIMAKIDEVTLEGANALARRLVEGAKAAVVTLGPVKQKQIASL